MRLFIVTGGIATGKSFVLNYMKKLGCSILQSDIVAKEIMYESWFKEKMNAIGIDMKNLKSAIEKNSKILDYIEELVHFKVQIRRRKWILNNALPIAIEIPLLFEKNLLYELQEFNPVVISTICSKRLQMRRIQKRKQSNELMKLILARQTSNEERVARSQCIIYTCLSKYVVKKQINKIFKAYNE